MTNKPYYYNYACYMKSRNLHYILGSQELIMLIVSPPLHTIKSIFIKQQKSVITYLYYTYKVQHKIRKKKNSSSKKLFGIIINK